MTSRPPQLRPLPSHGPPYGTAFPVPGAPAGVGIDVAARGFLEEEFELAGTARTWRTTSTPGAPHAVDSADYVTRVLVRRPADAAHASGTVHLEPLHPHRDGALTWRAAAEHILRTGGAWVGVTVYAHQARLLRERLAPEHYATLDIPLPGLEWDILTDAAEVVKSGAIRGLVAEHTIVSGWSATGSFVRVFLREGFARRHSGAVDGAVVFISSGGAGDAGYPPLSPESGAVPDDDPRRTIADVGIPVFEVLSETESETHEHQTRPDSDADGDRYRLYQVAGTAHIEPWDGEVLTNASMLAAAGLPSSEPRIVEERGDGRLDYVARAAFERMTEWIARGTRPPSCDRFSFVDDGSGGRMLARDADGNILGGVRTPWIEAPLASYAPHGTAHPDAERGDAGAPVDDPRLGAFLTGSMTRFPRDRVIARYGDEAGYRAAFDDAVAALHARGLLLEPDAVALAESAAPRWRAAVGDAAP